MHEKLSIIDFTNYREFLQSILQEKNVSISSLAAFTSVAPSNISQSLTGSRTISFELAIKIANYLELDEYEKEYLLTLVHIEKAGTEELKEVYFRQLRRIKGSIVDTNGGPLDKGFTSIPESKKNEFYSSWYYAGIHLLTSIEGMHRADTIAKYINIPLEQTENILQFLVSIGFCKKENEQYRFVELKTLIGNNSFLKSQHHKNWRIKALSHIPQYDYPNTFFSYPMCISKKDMASIQEMIMKLISSIDKKIINSPPEILACLNIDWFSF